MLFTSIRHALTLSKRVWFFIVITWLILFPLILCIQVSSEINAQRQEFEQQSESLYEIIRQRLDQNEAVLGGLDALFNTFPHLEFDGIRGYSRDMLRRYPHIYTIELQPRVDFADVLRFELLLSKKTKHPFHIKDFDFGGKRSWHTVGKRDFYFPITFMEPPIEAASPILGLDVYSEPKFRIALDATILSGKPSISIPFDLLEGGRGYLIFKAIFNTLTPSNVKAERYSQVTQVISLLIHTNKFLSRDELPSEFISMSLHHKNFKSNDPNGIIDKVDASNNNHQFASVFPLFQFTRQLSSESQPFVIETDRQVGLEVIHPLPTLMTLGATLAILLLLAVIYHQRKMNLASTKDAEDILAQEKENALVTLHSISDAVISLDADRRIRYMNLVAETSTRTTLNDAVGRLVEEVVILHYELSQSLIVSPFTQCMESLKVVDLPENSALVLDNHLRILVEGSVSPLFGTKNELAGVVLVFRDMGPIRRKALEAADASDQRLRQHQSDLAHVVRLNTMGEMAAGIAHEINQPLATILSYNQACIRLLQEKEPDAPTIINAMHSAAAQSKRAGKIIARLRAFVSKQSMRSAPVNINQVVQNVLSLSDHTLKDSQVTVIVDLAKNLPSVTADPIQIEQVVLNLVINGIDAMREVEIADRIIRILTTIENDRVRILIRDSGHGIPEYVMNHLFDPFFTTKKDGMGLGLTISYSIVETYGGTLKATNHRESGAEFSFSLAIRDPNAVDLDLSERE